LAGAGTSLSLETKSQYFFAELVELRAIVSHDAGIDDLGAHPD
jgi:hypothetical protein